MKEIALVRTDVDFGRLGELLIAAVRIAVRAELHEREGDFASFSTRNPPPNCTARHLGDLMRKGAIPWTKVGRLKVVGAHDWDAYVSKRKTVASTSPSNDNEVIAASVAAAVRRSR